MKVLFTSLLSFVLAFVAGCSGGTSGTGVSQVQGNLKTLSTGLALAGIPVTGSTSGSDAMSVTDADGNFSMALRFDDAEPAVFEFTIGGRRESVMVSDVPKQTRRILVDFVRDDNAMRVSVARTQFEVRDAPQSGREDPVRENNQREREDINQEGSEAEREDASMNRDRVTDSVVVRPQDTLSSLSIRERKRKRRKRKAKKQ